jgi:hypothetical protein
MKPRSIVLLLGALALLAKLREKTGRPSWWVLGLFAASPISFMVSGFHGNVDSLMVNQLPWDKALHVNEMAAQWAPWITLSWLVFAAYVTCNARFHLPIPAFFFRGRKLILETPREA